MDKTNQRSGWATLDPFQSLPDEDSSRGAAKGVAGVALYLGASYALIIALGVLGGTWVYGEAGGSAASSILINASGVAMAGFLAWRIWRKQSRWATTWVAIWLATEIGMKFWMIAAGEVKATANPWLLLLPLICACYTFVGLRGACKLPHYRKAQKVAVAG